MALCVLKILVQCAAFIWLCVLTIICITTDLAAKVS